MPCRRRANAQQPVAAAAPWIRCCSADAWCTTFWSSRCTLDTMMRRWRLMCHSLTQPLRLGHNFAPPMRHISPQLLHIDENYRVITLIFKKYGNLPLCLENCALFSLPLIFTNILYTYSLRYIIYLGEPSGNIILNYRVTFIHIYMHCYDPMFKNIYETVFFLSQCCRFFSSLFLLTIHLKPFHFLLVEFLLFQLISVNFTSCCLPQANFLQHFICFSIRKR